MKDLHSHRVFNRVIWAIDPLSADLELEIRSAQLIKLLTQQLNCSVEPLYVSRLGQLNPATLTFGDAETLEKEAERRLTHFLDRYPIHNSLPTRVLRAKGASLRKAVDALVDFATRSQADLIVINTHARKGMERFILGSFAESLLLASPIPILVSNPHSEIGTEISQIIYPTDFSEESREVFLNSLDLAKTLSAKIKLVHQVEYLYSDVTYPFVTPILSPITLEDVEKQQTDLGKEWVKVAKGQGLEAEFHLVPYGRNLVSELCAMTLAQQSVIAMASRSGAIASVLLGSLTREVIREALCPIFVFHPKNFTEQKKETI